MMRPALVLLCTWLASASAAKASAAQRPPTCTQDSTSTPLSLGELEFAFLTDTERTMRRRQRAASISFIHELLDTRTCCFDQCVRMTIRLASRYAEDARDYSTAGGPGYTLQVRSGAPWSPFKYVDRSVTSRSRAVSLCEQYEASRIHRQFPNPTDLLIIGLPVECKVVAEDLEAYEASWPSHDSVYDAVIWLEIAKPRFIAGDLERAAGAYQRAVATSDVVARAYAIYMLGWCQYRLGEVSLALRLLAASKALVADLDTDTARGLRSRIAADEARWVKVHH